MYLHFAKFRCCPVPVSETCSGFTGPRELAEPPHPLPCAAALIYLNKSSFLACVSLSRLLWRCSSAERNGTARHGGAGGAVRRADRAGPGSHGGAAAAGLGAGAGPGGGPEEPCCPPAPRAAGSAEPGGGGDGAPGWPRGGGVGGEPLLREVSPQDPGAAQVARGRGRRVWGEKKEEWGCWGRMGVWGL